MTAKLRFPLILLAHDLKSGKVLYWHDFGWSDVLQSPYVAHDDKDATYLNDVIGREVAKNKVVDASLEEVIIAENNHIKFRHFREIIKQNGPTIKYGGANV